MKNRVIIFRIGAPPTPTLFPYTTLFRSLEATERQFRALLDAAAADRIVVRVTLYALPDRSEEHTSELQSHHDLVCRLLLEKKHTASRLSVLRAMPQNSQL